MAVTSGLGWDLVLSFPRIRIVFQAFCCCGSYPLIGSILATSSVYFPLLLWSNSHHIQVCQHQNDHIGSVSRNSVTDMSTSYINNFARLLGYHSSFTLYFPHMHRLSVRPSFLILFTLSRVYNIVPFVIIKSVFVRVLILRIPSRPPYHF